MKKIISILILAISIIFLTACSENIYVEPDTIAVVFDNARFEDDLLVVDVYLTNGFEEEQYIEYMGFDIYSSDGSMYIAGAGFDILKTVPALGYIFFTIDFGGDYVFVTELDISNAGYSLDDIVLYYYQEAN